MIKDFIIAFLLFLIVSGAIWYFVQMFKATFRG